MSPWGIVALWFGLGFLGALASIELMVLAGMKRWSIYQRITIALIVAVIGPFYLVPFVCYVQDSQMTLHYLRAHVLDPEDME